MSLSDDDQRVLLELEREFTARRRRLPTIAPLSFAAALGLLLLGIACLVAGALLGPSGVVPASGGYLLVVVALASLIKRWLASRARIRPTCRRAR